MAAAKKVGAKKVGAKKIASKKLVAKKVVAQKVGTVVAKKVASKKVVAKKIFASNKAMTRAAAKGVPVEKAASRTGAAKKLASRSAAKSGEKPVASRKVTSKKATSALPVDDAAIAEQFHQIVNMTAAAIGAWLKTKESHVVGAKDGKTGTSEGGPESVGHRSGRRIIELLAKDGAALTSGDYAHMRKVIGYVRRHVAQKPAVEDVETSRWRYSLMNWGHDPSK